MEESVTVQKQARRIFAARKTWENVAGDVDGRFVSLVMRPRRRSGCKVWMKDATR